MLTQPVSSLLPGGTVDGDGHGACNQDTITFTSPTGGGVILPTLCGTLTGQHSKIFRPFYIGYLSKIQCNPLFTF